MIHDFSLKSLESPIEKMEETEEKVPKVTSTPLVRKSAPSLLLTRWILSAKRLSSKQDCNQIEDNSVQFECSEPPFHSHPDSDNIPSPIEDYSISISERTCSVLIDRTSLRINEDFIKNVLMEHMRQIGCKLHLWEDLERLGRAESETNAGTSFFATSKPNEINILLLYASFTGRTDLIRLLYEYKANVDYAEPEHDLTPLHLCAFRNCLDGVQYLIAMGASTDFKSKHTPLHYAAFGDAFDVARYFIQQGIGQQSSEDGETVLHAAARTNALQVLSLVAPNNPEINRLDPDGYAAIHHAADGGNPDCLYILLKANCHVDLLTKSYDTALHLAAAAGCAENVSLLVKASANLHLKNNRGHTALHLAARSHSQECTEILLKGGANPNAEDNEGRSPLHLALGRSLETDDVAELLLTRRANVNKADKYGYTPLHIAASNEMSRCVSLLIRNNADLSAKTKGGTTALSIVLRKTPTCLDAFEQKLDASMTLHKRGFVASDVELRMDFRPLLQHRRQGEIGFLDTFVKEGYKEILEHPLCQSFLELKWQRIRKYYFSRLLFYLIYVLILTSWVMIALARNCFNESHGYMGNSTLCTNSGGIYKLFHEHGAIFKIQWYMLVLITVFEIFYKLSVIPSYPSVRHFFTQAENLIEWYVILSVFITSFVYTGRTYAWQSHLGAFGVLCGWSNLMLMIGQLPLFGAYVAMFTSVQAQVFKLLLAYSCLLIGFTATFCVIFPHSHSFGSPHMGLIKVFAMMTGELNFDDLFFPSEDKIAKKSLPDLNETPWVLLQITSELSFLLFLLFVTIVLMNLLIGIAVDDIKGLQKTAGLAKLVRLTKLICDVEITLFSTLLPKYLRKWLRWFALIMPSPVQGTLTVRPLNPRERRLSRDVLSAAYKIAKEGDGHNFVFSRKKTYKPTSSTKTYLKGDVYASARRRRGLDEDTLAQDYNKLKDDIAQLRIICEKNQTLLREFTKTRNIHEQCSSRR